MANVFNVHSMNKFLHSHAFVQTVQIYVCVTWLGYVESGLVLLKNWEKKSCISFVTETWG